MSLPDLSWQVMYGRLAWTLVLAALALALVPARWRRSKPVLAALVAGFGVWNALPGEGPAAYWLGLAFQVPSAFLAALCGTLLFLRWQGRAQHAVLPLPLAAALALTGAVLYLDAMGLLALGWYYAGFGPRGAPLVALVLAIAAAWAVARGILRPYAVALLIALCAFAVLRLPTGNLWDTLLDPFLVGWALVSTAIALRRRRAKSRMKSRT